MKNKTSRISSAWGAPGTQNKQWADATMKGRLRHTMARGIPGHSLSPVTIAGEMGLQDPDVTVGIDIDEEEWHERELTLRKGPLSA